jgi:hypothetical protein
MPRDMERITIRVVMNMVERSCAQSEDCTYIDIPKTAIGCRHGLGKTEMSINVKLRWECFLEKVK